ncbi:hypothetical protein [uncultured Caulobacter sp.]|uniref:hypothetical protein n=1 Tax=uncultured Caulobacter sp. TaxID=158749 RepID=UPI002626E641|nr:hypothetical protein [uncultured Caulobacter sp.]
MLLSVMAFAAALQAAPRVEMPPAPFVQSPPPPAGKVMRDAKQREAWQARMGRIAKCRGYGVEHARGVAAESPRSTEILARRSSARARKLGEMPPAHGERAVLRTVDGCAISTPIVVRRDTPQP